MHYCTAPSATGLWTHRGPILTSDATHKGPGHHAFPHDEATNAWYIVYHRWNHVDGDGPYHGTRQVCIDELTYDENGLIKPVIMTDTGVPATTFVKQP